MVWQGLWCRAFFRPGKAKVIAGLLVWWTVACMPHASADPLQTVVKPDAEDRSHWPTGAELIAHDTQALRPEYLACMAQAGTGMPQQKVCVDAEYAYQDGELNRVYKQVMEGLSAADKPYLRHSQRGWVKFVYGERCKLTTDAALAESVDVRQCQVHATILRLQMLSQPIAVSSELAMQKSPPVPYTAPEYSASGQPDAKGVIILQPDINYYGTIPGIVRLQVSTCDPGREVFCQVRSASFEAEGKTYRLEPPPPQVIYDATPTERGVRESTVTMTDLNKDGHTDLMFWIDNLGNYGSPSYAFYLFDPKGGRFVENKALEAAVNGHEIADQTNNRFVLWYRSGPCERGDKVIEVRGMRVVTIRKRDYDTCKGDLPTDASLLK